jgi:hypothetical protein
MSRQEIRPARASRPPVSIALLGSMFEHQRPGVIVALFAEHDTNQLGRVLRTEL